MLKRKGWWLLVAGCFGVMAAAQAQQFIYKWTDTQGQIQYSELAPPSGVKYEMVRKSGGAENPAAEVDLNKDQADLAKQVAEQQQKEQEEIAKAEKEAEDVKTKNCEIAKKNITTLQGDSPVFRTDAQGQKVVLDAAAREAELKKAQKDQDYYCNP